MAFLLKREGREADPLFELLERGVIRIALGIEAEMADLRALMHRYCSRPMSLADACLKHRCSGPRPHAQERFTSMPREQGTETSGAGHSPRAASCFTSMPREQGTETLKEPAP